MNSRQFYERLEVDWHVEREYGTQIRGQQRQQRRKERTRRHVVGNRD